MVGGSETAYGRRRRRFDSSKEIACNDVSVDDEPNQKRRNNSDHRTSDQTDRISDLPDTVLLHILSLMPATDAVKTGVLSRRWLYFWTSVPMLHFSDNSFSKRGGNNEFLKFVDRTLSFHDCTGLHRFQLDIERYAYPSYSFVDAWIRIATRANVKDLRLNLRDRRSYNSYVLPQHLYTNSEIIILTSYSCDFAPTRLISWKSLKYLSIGKTSISEVLLQKIFAGSPALEVLQLRDFSGLNRLDTGESNLKYMELINTKRTLSGYHNDYQSDIEIVAPKVQSLYINGCANVKIKLRNVQMLVYCYLHFAPIRSLGGGGVKSLDKPWMRNMLRELLDDLAGVNTLVLGDRCVQLLSNMAMEGVLLSSMAPHRKCLELYTKLESFDIPGIAMVLHNSPFLETLVIDMSDSRRSRPQNIFDDIPEGYLTSEKEFVLPSLKTVRIKHYGLEDIIPFIKFLLKNAKVLETMVFTTHKAHGEPLHSSFTPERLMEMTGKLLALPKSSPQAIVTII